MSRYPEIRRSIRGTRSIINYAHSYLELNLVISGRATMFVEGHQHDLVPGTLLWILPGQHHRLLRSPDFEMWIALVEPHPYETELLADLGANPCRLLASHDALELDRLLAHISQDPDHPAVYLSGIDYLIRSAWNMTMTSPGRARRALHPAVSKALELLRAEGDIPTSAQVASRCGVKQSYLARLLIEQTGWGFVEWRNRIRIERFTLVWNESHDLMRASFEAGFGSYTQFHRVFVDLMGCTPGEWAKGDAKAGSVHSMTNMGSEGEGQRMAWYGLAGLVHPAAARFLAPGFAEAFLASALSADPHASHAEQSTDASTEVNWAALPLELPALISAIAETSPEKVEKLQLALNRLDHIQRFLDVLGRLFPAPPDLSQIITLYLYVSCYGVTRLVMGSIDEVTILTYHVHQALQASGILARLNPENRQQAAAAFVTQTSILLGAIEAARSSGSEKRLVRVGEDSLEACIATTGLDLSSQKIQALFC